MLWCLCYNVLRFHLVAVLPDETMAFVTVKQAEILTGKSRQTLWRDRRKGRISIHKDKNGSNLYDPSELERTYGSLKQLNSNESATGLLNETSENTALLRQERDFLKEKNIDLEEQLKKSHEREEKLQMTADRLTNTIVQQTHLIEYHAQKQSKPFLKRLFG